MIAFSRYNKKPRLCMHVCMWFVYVCMYVCGLYMYSHSHTHHIPPPAHTQQSELERDLQKMVLKRCNKNCFISIYYLYMGPGPGARRVCPSRALASLSLSLSLTFCRTGSPAAPPRFFTKVDSESFIALRRSGWGDLRMLLRGEHGD